MNRAARLFGAIVVVAVGAATPAGADPMADLMDMLPAGYSSDACTPIDSPGALATVTCRDNFLPGGPTEATYRLFGDDTGMYEAFEAQLRSPDWAPATCPGMHSPDATAIIRSDGTKSGFIACGRAVGADWMVRDGGVAWTQDADRFLGVAYVGYRGQEYPTSLFNWVRAQQIESECATSGGTYDAWRGDAGINYSSCCYDANGAAWCEDYVDGNYQGRSQG